MVLFPHLSGSCSVILKGSGFLVLLLYCRTWCLFVYRAITCSMSLLFAFSVNWKCQTVLLLRRRYWHAAVRWCLGVRRLDNGYLRLFELLIWTICYYMHYAIWSWSWSSHRYVMLMGACITTISWRTVKWASKNNISVGKLVACLKAGFNTDVSKVLWKMFLLGPLLWKNATHSELNGQNVDLAFVNVDRCKVNLPFDCIISTFRIYGVSILALWFQHFEHEMLNTC